MVRIHPAAPFLDGAVSQAGRWRLTVDQVPTQVNVGGSNPSRSTISRWPMKPETQDRVFVGLVVVVGLLVVALTALAFLPGR